MKEALTEEEIQHFIHQGFVKIENAFPRELADAVICRPASPWEVSQFMPQPPVLPRTEDATSIAREGGNYSPVEIAIRMRLNLH